MNVQPLKTLMEVREDFMLSPAGDSEPTLRTAHFLKPIAKSIHESNFKVNPFSSSFVSGIKERPFTTHFHGWKYNQEKWYCWVDKLKPKYESLWRKAGIFQAIMSTKCYIHKYVNLLIGVVDKWCSETNTFVFPFGEATITLEDVMVLGGYPILGDPVFISLEDQEMREVEKILILAREHLTQPTTSPWMDMFIDKGSEIEHEAFLATWLSLFVFPHYYLVKSCVFPIAVHLARGNPIALAPAVLASLYKDLSFFKKTIVDMSKYPVDGDSFPLEVTIHSPFYLVQIWVWERFKNLQPQPMLINHGDPILIRWHKVRSLHMNIDSVKLALDSATNDFLWRPYVRYSDKCEMFYPNDEIWIPFKKDLVDEQMLSFVISLRVSELVGFDSIEQYLPHRVAMQFGFDQDVPSYVPRFNETKAIAWKNYCRPISDKKLYFPARLFEADVTTRYAKWWKQSMLGRGDFLQNIVRKKRSPGSRKHRPFVGKAIGSGNDVGVPLGFPPNLVDSLTFAKFCDDGSKPKTRMVDDFYADVDHENFAPDCSQMTKHNTFDPSIYVEDSNHVSKDNIELSVGSLEEGIKDTNGSQEAKMSSDRLRLSETQGKSCSYAIRNKVSSFNKVTAAQHDDQFLFENVAQVEAKQTIEEIEIEENDHEVVVLLKQQYLKNQEELKRLARQQEEIVRLIDLREKSEEEWKQLVTNVLMNQQPSSSS
ncbi:serine/threonine-protein phosphatase 7 long form protein [Trifolium repens]|nr:serine/threonine-protein phosphatase 7 long form protein [Trifolium repens]KAK2387290.1 serine/threonine-protein phosphatase 7 long form protein [Trifolium repens]KAK2387311.1 serine/threonine-protein phosphatase 7 long form protein [Trifolium repens]